MATIDKNTAPSIYEIEEFSKQISFPLPGGFMKFYREANGADISSDEFYTTLWPLTDLIKLNKDYNVEEYAPEFFIFGSDGGDTAFAIEKSSGSIFEIPFIGMSKEEAVFKSMSFNEFLKTR